MMKKKFPSEACNWPDEWRLGSLRTWKYAVRKPHLPEWRLGSLRTWKYVVRKPHLPEWRLGSLHT